MNGTGCQLCPAVMAGVAWSPATMKTSGSNSRMAGISGSSASRHCTLASKSPSSPAASAGL